MKTYKVRSNFSKLGVSYGRGTGRGKNVVSEYKTDNAEHAEKMIAAGYLHPEATDDPKAAADVETDAAEAEAEVSNELETDVETDVDETEVTAEPEPDVDPVTDVETAGEEGENGLTDETAIATLELTEGIQKSFAGANIQTVGDAKAYYAEQGSFELLPRIGERKSAELAELFGIK